MMRTTGWLFMVTACVLTGAVPVAAQTRAELSGRWVLEGPVPPTLEHVVAAWEEVAADATSVALRRAARQPLTETYLTDDLDREVARVGSGRRTCRTTWDQGRLVIACRERHAGPAGATAVITTREVRSLDGSGRLVVETTARSDTWVASDRRVYRRDGTR